MPAHAHPADMYSQNVSLSLTPLGLHIDWTILPGPFLADAAWASADTDHSGSISAAEAQAWVAPFLSDFSLTLDGHPTDKPLVQGIRWPATVDVLRTGEDPIDVMLSLDWPHGLAGQHALIVHNAHLEPNTLNGFSLAASDGLTFARPAQNNGQLAFDLFFPEVSGSTSVGDATHLTSWTSGTPNLPDFTASLSSLAAKLTNPSKTPGLEGQSTGGGKISNPEGAGVLPAKPELANSSGQVTAATAALTGLVRNVQASPLFLLSAFLLSLALGSLHALTPGHGKALVGAYLVGSQGRTRDAVLLGGIVTMTHTGSVLLLGLLTLVASHYILPSLIVPWLELISGLLVILFGLNLLIQRRRDLSSGTAGHAHDHVHEHDHVHPHAHAIDPTSRAARNTRPEIKDLDVVSTRPFPARHTPSLSPDPLTSQPANLPTYQSTILKPHSIISDRKSLLALGISGGLVPCPDAIAILLVAVALNRVPFGMLLIVSFSIGLAAVLIGIGLAMVHGVRLLSHSDWLNRFSGYAPIVSALVVTGLGAGLTFNAWNSFRFSQAMSGGARLSANASSPASINGRLAPTSSPWSARPVLYMASDPSGDDQLYRQPAPGAASIQLTHEANGVTGYSVSPDGRTILYSVFELDGGSSIWAINSDGSGRRLALDCPQAECNSPAWYPDGSKVAYERLENTADAVTIPRFSIWWLDLQSGKTDPVFQDGAFASTAPQFSPDGRWLSYISAASNTLVAFNMEDGRTLSVPLGSQAAIPETWSPSGDALLFGNNTQGGDLHVKTFTLASGKIADLGGPAGESDYFAAWSPDGQWIAIDRNVPGHDAAPSSNQVWLVRPDGSQAHVLLHEAGASYSSLSWSPDGRLLLYSRYTLSASAQSTGRFDVCSTDIATGQSTVLVPGGDTAQFGK